MLKRIILPLILIASLFSCSEDALDLKDPNVPTVADFWKSVDDAEKGLVATYSQFTRPGNWGRWIYFRYDLASDEGYSLSPWTDLADWTRFKYSNYNFIQGGSLIYKSAYKQIFEANQVIAYSPGIETKTNDESIRLKQIIAQAKFIRAFNYFTLNVLFGQAEVVTEPSNPGDLYKVADTDSLNSMVIADLEDAIVDLPAEWSENEEKPRNADGCTST